MALIARIYEPDVAVLPIGDHFTMGPTRGGGRARAARRQALRAVPLRHVPDPHRHARAAARARARRRGHRTGAGRIGRAVRERWFGATRAARARARARGLARRRGRARARRRRGRREPARGACAGNAGRRPGGRPPEAVKAALARPEVASVLVPTEELLALDLTRADLWLARSRPTRSSACDLDAGQWGVAVQSKFLAVGSVVPWAEPGVGAVATQAYANPRYGPDGLALLRQGLSAEEVVKRLTEADDGRDERQLGVVDAAGPRRHVHRLRLPRLGGRPHRRRATPPRGTSSSRARPSTRSRRPSRRAKARWPSDCWRASRPPRPRVATGAASSPPRCSSSSGTAATRASPTSLVDLRVDDHEAPIEELRRLYGLHEQLFGKTPRDQWLPVDDELRAEIDERLARLGYERSPTGPAPRTSRSASRATREIDPVVLSELRRRR